MKAEMFLMEEPCGQSNHLILIGLPYMVDSANAALVRTGALGPARPLSTSSPRLR